MSPDKAWNITDFPKPVGRFTKTSLFDSTTSRKAYSWCLLSLSNRKNSHSFLRISRHIFPRVCARSTLLLRICKVNCDWSLTAEVTEIYSRLSFADSFSRRVKLKPKLNRMLSQANVIRARQNLGFERQIFSPGFLDKKLCIAQRILKVVLKWWCGRVS